MGEVILIWGIMPQMNEAFLRSGCVVEIHPQVPATDRRPDFLVSCDKPTRYGR